MVVRVRRDKAEAIDIAMPKKHYAIRESTPRIYSHKHRSDSMFKAGKTMYLLSNLGGEEGLD